MLVVLFKHQENLKPGHKGEIMARKRKYQRRKPQNAKYKKLQKKLKKNVRKWNPDFGILKKVIIWIFKIALVCFLAFVAVWYYGQKVSIVGDSMNPVLYNGDVVLVNRVTYTASSPKRGDIIIFKPKGNEKEQYYVKRIVGLPGETLQIIENRIYINGEKLEEDYEATKIDDVGIAGEEITLGNDEYFVLGDNRASSEDSRNADIGAVKRDYIYGKAWYISSPGKHRGFIE